MEEGWQKGLYFFAGKLPIGEAKSATTTWSVRRPQQWGSESQVQKPLSSTTDRS